jgi:uncharacterized phiE125 gp8 family phage protein
VITYTRLTPPAAGPLTIEQAREACAVDGDYHDTLLTSLMAAAVAHVEQVTGRTLLSQGWRAEIALDTPAFAGAQVIGIDWPPVTAVTSVALRAIDGTETALDLAEVTVTPTRTGAALRRAPATWPSTGQAVVGFTTGAATAADVPVELHHAVRLLVAHWYLNREAVTAGGATDLPFGVKELCASHRVRWIA